MLSSTFAKKTEKLLADFTLLNTVHLGLKDEHTFMVKEYSTFLSKLYVVMGSLFSHPLLTNFVKENIFFLIELIEHQCSEIKTIK